MKKIIFIFSCLILCVQGQAQISRTIDVKVAGTLSSLISNDEMNKITELTLTGNIDARDFRCFYSMNYLSVLDLSDVNIIAYKGGEGVGPNYNYDILYPANEMPPYSFDFLDYNTILTSLILPKSLKSLANCALYNCVNLYTLTIYDSLISIGSKALYSCFSITNINIPKGVTTIASDAFSNCKNILTYNVNPENLHYTSQEGVLYNKDMSVLIAYPKAKEGSFTIPATVDSIGNSAFNNCINLTNVLIPNSVNEIGEMAFMGCTGIYSIIIPDKVKKIDSQAFEFCNNLNSVSLPDSLQYIGEYAFCDCEQLINIVIPKKISYIGNFAFAQCMNLKSISLPDSLNSISEWMFIRCISLKEIVIPNTIDSIKYAAFQSCAELENLVIGKNVKFIDSRCFVDCVSLKSIYAYSTNPVDLSLSADVFSNVDKTNCILYVPQGSKAAYIQASQWKDFKTIEEITTGIQPIDLSNIKIITDNGKLIIENANIGDKVEIYDISGIRIKDQIIGNNQMKIQLKRGIYLICIENYSDKVIIR